MTDNQNPYAAPEAKVIGATVVAAAGEDRLRSEPARLPAGAGSEWLGLAWDSFRKAPALLIAMCVLYFVVAMGVQMIPVVGGLFMSLTFAIWVAGWSLTFDKLQRGVEVTIGDLFSGFSHPRAGRLLIIGALYLGLFFGFVVLMAVLALVAFGIGSFTDFSSLNEAEVGARLGANLGILFGLLLVFVTGIFLILGYVAYAPVLVTMHDIPVLDACALSLRALLRNWLAMTVYGLILVGLFIASVLTLFLALLVIIPLMMGVAYISYRQMFLET